MPGIISLSLFLIASQVQTVAPPLEGDAAGVRRRGVVRGTLLNAPVVRVADDFRKGASGWDAGFSDYAPINDKDGLMELDHGIRPLPPEITPGGTAFYITGHNRSDDLFMFLRRKLTAEDGMRPNQMYEISYRVVLASNAGGEQCGGIGGHPGYSLFLKVGGAGVEPQVILTDKGGGESFFYYLNLDKGNQAVGGFAATVAGHTSTESDHCYFDAPFQTIVREHRHPHVVTADSAGTLWLLVGTDSGFEGKTVLYYQSIEATLRPVP